MKRSSFNTKEISRIALLWAGALLLSACFFQQGTNSDDHQIVHAENDAIIDYTQYVNPFIGTDGTGHTFPGAASPFGMVQLSPDTGNHSWDHTSGYQYQDTSIIGFSHNHLSGTGVSDLGDISIQPFSGDINRNSFDSRFSKDSERASPGFYQVELLDNHVKVELSASTRVGMHRYTYTKDDNHNVYLDFQHGVVNQWIPKVDHVIDAQVTLIGNNTIEGFIETTSWVQHKTFFVIHFDSPFKVAHKLEQPIEEKAPKYVLEFGQLTNNQLQVKVGLSTVSIEGANANLQGEVPHWEFDKVASDTKEKWQNYLKRIDIEAPQAQKEIFYTGIYHLMIQPNITSDLDGRYRGYDDNIYTAIGDGHYSTFSLWDTFRAAHPMYTIIAPEKVDEFVNSLVAQQEVQGFLPIWGLMNKETYTMIGNHAVPVVVDAILKGIENIDAQRAYTAIYETLTVGHKNSDWALLEQYGYYPYDLLDRDGESVSRTLEHTVDDAAAARLAELLGDTAVAERFAKRAEFYRNLFDASTGFMRGKNSLGNWRENFDPLEATSPMNNPGDYTEANSYQYSWAAQHAAAGMIELHGGNAAFIAKLDEFFTTFSEDADIHLGQEALIGQYAHGNEPSHHIAYLYQLAGSAEKTRAYVHQIYTSFYDNTPSDIVGNEDCGQMSAWYLFSTLGFYPVDPSSGDYIFAEPQVTKATVHLANGNTLVIEHKDHARLSTAPQTDSMNIKFNEQYLQDSISHAQLLQGGSLTFSYAKDN